MSERKQSVSFDNDEIIYIKPSTELKADEYEVQLDKMVVHIFRDSIGFNEINGNTFQNLLKQNEYNVPDENIHNLREENIFKTIEKINEDAKNCSGLIVFISGEYEIEGKIIAKHDQLDHISVNTICSKFMSYNCEELRDKPKIIIMQLTKFQSDTESDGEMLVKHKFDSPAESDIAVIFNTTKNSDPTKFITDFCNNINQYGKKEDILTLATIIEPDELESPCMIISTLTKKFYFIPNEVRGHPCAIADYVNELETALKQIKDKVEDLKAKTDASKKKKKLSILESFRQTKVYKNIKNLGEEDVRKSVPKKNANSKEQQQAKKVVKEATPGTSKQTSDIEDDATKKLKAKKEGRHPSFNKQRIRRKSNSQSSEGNARDNKKPVPKKN